MVDLLFGDVQRGQRRVWTLRLSQHSFIDEYTDDELCVRYRLGRESILFITDLLACYLHRDTWRNHALQPLTQVLIALRIYASGSFLQVVGDTIGIDKSTISWVVTKVSRELVPRRNRFVKWPSTNAKLTDSKNAFYHRGGFSCVIGCVDGTHIRILAPSQHENGYVNCKGFHSINVQAISSHERQLLHNTVMWQTQTTFTNIVARWPGSTHESYFPYLPSLPLSGKQ